MVTHPCTLGFRCPYAAVSEDALPICTYPKLPAETTEEDQFGIADEGVCELMPFPSDIFDLMVAYDDEAVQDAVRQALARINEEAESIRDEIRGRNVR